MSSDIAVFSIEYEAIPDAKLQWYMGKGTPETRTKIDGAINKTLTIRNITKNMNGIAFSCLVKNSKGEVWSNLVVLTVIG